MLTMAWSTNVYSTVASLAVSVPSPNLTRLVSGDLVSSQLVVGEVRAGRRVEIVSKKQKERASACCTDFPGVVSRQRPPPPPRLRSSVSVTEPPDEEDHTSSPYFGSRVQQAREYLVGFLAR